MRRPRALRALLVTALAGLLAGAAAVPASAATTVRPPRPTSYVVADPNFDYSPSTGKGAPFVPLTNDAGKPISTVYTGISQGAAYRIEKPVTGWNGDVVFWEHGYRGTGNVVYVDSPYFDLRRHYIEAGFAWAASSYDANGYDIGSGVRSTRRLGTIVDRTIGKAQHRYLQGVSMGGHIIGVLLDRYAQDDANPVLPGDLQWYGTKDYYSGAVPMCGVLGGTQLFNYYLSYNLAAQALSGVDAYPIPADYLSATGPLGQMIAALGLPPLSLTAQGQKFEQVAVDLTGGPRPGAQAGFRYWSGASSRSYFLFGVLDPTGTIGGVEPGQVATNVGTDYPNVTTPSGQLLDTAIQRVARDPRTDPYARNAPIPAVRADMDVPVLTLHTLGDYFVPFSMEQDYKRAAIAHGNGGLVVQRAVRALEHCEFTPQEAASGFDDMITWARSLQAGGPVVKPAGNDVLDPAAVSDPTYGCRFTSEGTTGTRPAFPPCPATLG